MILKIERGADAAALKIARHAAPGALSERQLEEIGPSLGVIADLGKFFARRCA